VLALALVLAGTVSVAQTVPEPVRVRANASPNVIGSGARALGMGGAFIAVADDATAASWNPGGLTQLERPEASIVYSWKRLYEDFSDTAFINPDGTFEVSLDDINYLSFVYPFRHTLAGRNFVFSLNYQRKYDYDMEFDYRARLANMVRDRVSWRDIASGGGGLSTYTSTRYLGYLQSGGVTYRQEGGLGSLSPAFGFEVTDKLSLGVTAHFWDQSLIPNNEWKVRSVETPTLLGFGRTELAENGIPFLTTNYQFLYSHKFERQEDFEDYEATSYTFGLLWHPLPRVSVGGVYHTKYAGTVTRTLYEKHRSWLRTWGGGSAFFPPAFDYTYDQREFRIEYPTSYGVGVAYRFPNDKLTVSVDVTCREWDEFVLVDRQTGQRTSPVTGLPKYLSHHDNAYAVRAGGEYVFVDPTRPTQKYLPSLRAGLFYDPEPASGRSDWLLGALPDGGEPDDYYGFTLGAGVLIGSRVNLDMAYEFRYGNDVRRDTLTDPAAPWERGFSEDVTQHSFYLSTVVYF